MPGGDVAPVARDENPEIGPPRKPAKPRAVRHARCASLEARFFVRQLKKPRKIYHQKRRIFESISTTLIESVFEIQLSRNAWNLQHRRVLLVD